MTDYRSFIGEDIHACHYMGEFSRLPNARLITINDFDAAACGAAV